MTLLNEIPHYDNNGDNTSGNKIDGTTQPSINDRETEVRKNTVYLPQLSIKDGTEPHQHLPPLDSSRIFVLEPGDRYTVDSLTLSDAVNASSGYIKGSQGVIIFGEDTRLGRPVAMKVIHHNSIFGVSDTNKEITSRIQDFYTTARILANLEGIPHVVKVYDVTAVENNKSGLTPILIMEKLDGVSLDILLAQGYIDSKKNLKKILTIIEQVSQTLDAIHKKGIIHSDVKPENILLRNTADTDKIDTVLIDFDGAVWNDTYTKNQIIMSFNYSGPEYEKADTAFIGPGADQYALAMTTCALLDYDPTVAHPETAELTTVIQKATSQDPKDRYSSCKEFYDALQNALTFKTV